jgi:hypothetical protein
LEWGRIIADCSARRRKRFALAVRRTDAVSGSPISISTQFMTNSEIRACCVSPCLAGLRKLARFSCINCAKSPWESGDPNPEFFVRSTPNLLRSHHRQAVSVAALLVLVLLFVPGGASRAAQAPDLQNPTSFFTNVASRLLQAQLGVDLNRIQIYPTNEYTPAVHRVLQLTANVYDAATNRDNGPYPYLPTVFRPLFTNDSGTIYINRYVEEPGLGILSVPMRDLASADDRAVLQTTDMVYGVPIVIGAKKGFPNFNEFGLLNDIRVARTLTFHRNAAGQTIVRTNQSYTLSISNALGIEAWNSYTSAFPRTLQLRTAADIACSVTIGTNSTAFVTGPDGSH